MRKATNINWDIDMESALDTLDCMTAEAASEALGVPKNHYANMTSSERHDFAEDLWRHSPATLEEFMGLPDSVILPATLDDAEDEDITDYLSDKYGFCINGYDVEDIGAYGMATFTEVMKSDPDHAFDYISNNGYSFRNSELVDIIKELLYSIHSNVKESEARILEDAAIELDEQYDEQYQNQES